MLKFLKGLSKILGLSSENTEDSKNTEDSENIDEKIAKCKAEIAELKGTGTMVINFSEKIGKTLFVLASSSDESNKNPEDNVEKINNLESELAILYSKKKEQPEKQKEESSDSPDGLTKEKLKGDLLEYVTQLEEKRIPYEVIRKDGLIGIRTKLGDDPDSMPNMLKNMMKKMVSKLSRSSEDPSVDKNSDSNLDDGVKSQAKGVVADLANVVLDFDEEASDDQSWYDSDELLKVTRNNTNMDQDDKNDNSELLGITQSEIFEMQISSAKEIADKGKTALMPINIDGNHWVGGAMTQEGGKFKFIHNDPLGQPINEDLQKTLKSQGVEVIDLRHEQQKDGYNCGPFTADNLSKFAEAIKNKKTGSSVSGEDFQADLKKELRFDGDKIRKEQQSEIEIGNLKSPTTPQASSRKGQEIVRQ